VRILFLARGFEDYVIELVNALSVHVEVHIVVSAKDEWIAAHLSPAVRVFYSKAPRVSSLSNLFAMVRIAEYIRCVRPAIIHLQSGVSWELMIKAMFPGIPMVVTMHDLSKHPSWSEKSIKYKFQQWGLRMAIRLADALIVHGEWMLEYANTLCVSKGLKKSIRSISHGVITRYGTGVARVHLDSAGHVLFFGNMNKYKGIEYLIKAEPLIRKKMPGVTIRIEGNAEQANYYRGLLPAESRIEMRTERVDDKRVAELFQRADVIVLPYVEASQSGVLQLALAFAVPPVVTQVGGLPDVVTHGVSGLVVPPYSESALAAAIVELLSNIDLRRRVIVEQQIARDGEFSWKQIGLRTLDLYTTVLQEHEAQGVPVSARGNCMPKA